MKTVLGYLNIGPSRYKVIQKVNLGSLTINLSGTASASTLDLTNGSVIRITGGLILDNDIANDCTITASASAGQIQVAGDVTNTGAGAGSFVWNSGTVPILQLYGTAAQSAALPGGPAVEISKSTNKVTPTSVWTSAVTITQGTLELTSAYNQTLAAVTIAAAGTLSVASRASHTLNGLDNSGTVTITASMR